MGKKQLTTAFSTCIYLRKMFCGKRRKWHFRDPKLNVFLQEHLFPNPPSLELLRYINLRFLPA